MSAGQAASKPSSGTAQFCTARATGDRAAQGGGSIGISNIMFNISGVIFDAPCSGEDEGGPGGGDGPDGGGFSSPGPLGGAFPAIDIILFMKPTHAGPITAETEIPPVIG